MHFIYFKINNIRKYLKKINKCIQPFLYLVTDIVYFCSGGSCYF